MQVCNTLANDLNQALNDYQTFDKKKLTESEVIVALGFILGSRLKKPERIALWLQQISVAAFSAASPKEKP